MPSPFPGMDPFLESPDFFPGLHGSLITYSTALLQDSLPDDYVCGTGERLWVEQSSRFIEPDAGYARRTSAAAPGGTAVLERPTATGRRASRRVTVRHDRRRERFINIYKLDRDRRPSERKRTVAVIEVLSPANKAPGPGRDLYRRKQREVLDSDLHLIEHLIEIDLLRAGRHTTAVSRAAVETAAGRFDYHVCVVRGEEPYDSEVYPVTVREPLPTFEVPLLPDDGVVELDLGAVFTAAYRPGGYHKQIEYTPAALDDLDPPLREEDRAWAEALLAPPAEESAANGGDAADTTA